MISVCAHTVRCTSFRLLSRSNKCIFLPSYARTSFSTGQIFRNEKSTVRDVDLNEEKNNDLNQFASDFESSLDPEKLTDISPFRRKMEPLAKKLFLGKLNPIIFSYPDVLPNDRYFSLERRIETLNKTMLEKRQLLQDTIDNEGRIPKDVLFALRSQGFYGIASKAEHGGEGLTVTETTRLLEELALIDLSLSETIAGPVTLGLSAIQRFGTAEQKAKYLPSLTSGKSISTICMADDECGSDAGMTKAKAERLPEEEIFILTGKKTWVTNGPTADIFIVFANVRHKGNDGVQSNQLTAFIVDRKSPGVTVHLDEREKKIGLKGLETCAVSFNQTPVPESNVIVSIGSGSEILKLIFADQRISSAARMSAGLRKVLDMTVKHCLSRKIYGNSLATYDQVKLKLSLCANSLFALESMVYMSAGLSDYQLDPDVSLEYAMTKLFAIKTSREICAHCSDLVGSGTYLADHPLGNLINDLKAFDWWDSNQEMLSLYIGLTGIKYVGENLFEDVMKVRNPLMFPGAVFKRLREMSNSSKKEPKLVLRLGDHVHPTLALLTDVLEVFVLRFGYSVNQMVVNEGYNAQIKEMDLVRLADVSTQIYAIACMLARASRSYAGGHVHGEHETHLVLAYINNVKARIENELEQIPLITPMKNDRNMIYVSDYMIDKGIYSPVHPVTKNFF